MNYESKYLMNNEQSSKVGISIDFNLLLFSSLPQSQVDGKVACIILLTHGSQNSTALDSFWKYFRGVTQRMHINLLDETVVESNSPGISIGDDILSIKCPGAELQYHIIKHVTFHKCPKYFKQNRLNVLFEIK